jgi:rhodanese-related sulfurtransferase
MAELENEVTQDMYYLSTDELAHLLISGDPGIQLVDIRENADTLLTRAVNVPADSVLSEKFIGLFFQNTRKMVLYSDDISVQKDTWMKLKYDGISNIYMLRGGLTAWKKDILDPTYPGPNAAQNDIDLYTQRMAARQYFSGAKALPETEFKVIIPQGGRKRKKVEGGCS